MTHILGITVTYQLSDMCDEHHHTPYSICHYRLYYYNNLKKTGDRDEECILKTGKRQRDNATIEINMRTILQQDKHAVSLVNSSTTKASSQGTGMARMEAKRGNEVYKDEV
jgi:nitric oxide synthase oxygenase domain/subunit